MNNKFLQILSAVTLLFIPLCIVAQPRALPPGYAQDIKLNFVRTWEATAPESNPNALTTRGLKDVKQTTQYFDGLGRPLQTVLKEGSLETAGNIKADLVSPVLYDEFGREQFKYLPFASTATDATKNNGLFKYNPFQQQATFYNSQLSGQAGETNIGGLNWAYGKTNFEASPLNRVNETYAQGASWVGSESSANPRAVKMKYWINTEADAVRIWNVADVSNSFGTYSTTATYAAGELYKNVTEDERGNQVIEFKDKSGQVILKKVQLTATAETTGAGSNHSKWLCTYYIYDDLNNLRAVIQPEGVKLLDDNNWTDCNPISVVQYPKLLSDQTFRYEYDNRNRMIMKKVPGAGDVYMVYDPWDRLVLSQDANMRANSQYMVTKYDALNRPIITGIYTYYGTIQQARDLAKNSDDYRYEVRASGGNGTGYSSQCWPETNYDILSVTYYDDYGWDGNPFSAARNEDYDSEFKIIASNENYPYPQPLTQSFATKGFVTGGMVRVLGTTQFLHTINSYDDRGRVIQVRSKNITGGEDVLTTQYDFSGKPLIQYQVSPKNFTSTQTEYVLTRFEYDDLGRVLNIKKKVSSQIGSGALVNTPEVEVVRNEYDKLGQLRKKEIGKKRNTSDPTQYTSTPIETLTYDYNIRGWLLGVNRDYTRNTTNTNYFGFDLGYDKINNNLVGNKSYAKAQFNGNIGGMLWKSKGDGEIRRYDFDYDAINRLLRADFTQYTGNEFNQTANLNFNVKMGDGVNAETAYDANGNIRRMQQWGLKLTTSEQIDDLRYTYETGTNKLRNVIDFNDVPETKLGDFRTSTNHPQKTNKLNYISSGIGDVNAIVDYVYDANGNLRKDLNKDMGNGSNDGIIYNHLNLPAVITMRRADGSIKGTITFTYDAAGNKLKKVVSENPSSTNGNISTTKETLYIGGFVFESLSDTNPNTTDYNNKLQFGGQEEGRIRALYIDQNNPNLLTGFAYDYMLKDHLGNVRMVLTDELEQGSDLASMEIGDADKENAVFSNIGNTRVENPEGYPVDNYTNPHEYVSEVKGNGQRIGPGVLLKVMAGDKFNLRVTSWYKTNGTAPSAPITDFINDLVFMMAAHVGNTATKGTMTELQNSGVFTPGAASFLNTQNSYTNTRPKAFVSWVLFDEQLNLAKDASGNIIASGYSGYEQVPEESIYQHGTQYAKVYEHVRTNLPVNKSGYLYIYVNNETPNISVFFDNLQVTHIKGPILEETHYYPFGLVMSGISSKALNGAPENKRKWNKGSELESKEFSDGSGLELYSTFYRSLDPQLGRFWQIDPKPDYSQSLYSSMNNNPISFNDPLGDTIVVQDAKMQKQILKDLGKVYGKKSGYFQFNSSGVLGFTVKGTKALVGSVVGNMLTGGRIEKVNALANSLAGAAKVMNSTEMTTIVYSNDKLNVTGTHASTGQTQTGIRPTDTGGEFTLTKTDNPNGFSVGGRNFDNVIFINPKSSTTSTIAATQLYNPSQQLLLQAVTQGGIQVTSQRHSLLMHGLGHVIYQSPTAQPNVIRYDNYNRILSGDALKQDLDGSHQ